MNIRAIVGNFFSTDAPATIPSGVSSLIFIFSSFPTVQTTEFFLGDFLIKKSAHLFEYGVLAILLYRALLNYDVNTNKALFFAILIAGLYGVSDEFHQSFIPGRGPAVRDVIIDTIGATIGIFLTRKYLESKLAPGT